MKKVRPLPLDLYLKDSLASATCFSRSETVLSFSEDSISNICFSSPETIFRRSLSITVGWVGLWARTSEIAGAELTPKATSSSAANRLLKQFGGKVYLNERCINQCLKVVERSLS